MIEARATWTLEGPDDSISFSPAGPFTITEKPKTAVDDRRDTYDYPLDDGAYVGDAYAGHRVWSFRGILVASSHADRNQKMQQLSALVNSLRRADGLLKWEPDGFDPVQSTVRRMGSIDFAGGAGLHVPFSFSLIAGDPRVYSQTEHTQAIVAGSATLGTEILSTDSSGMESGAVGTTNGLWQSHTALSLSSTYARTGTKSLMTPTVGGAARAFNNLGNMGSPGTTYRFSVYGRAAAAATSRNAYLDITWLTLNGLAIVSSTYGSQVALSTSAFTQLTAEGTMPAGAAYIQIVIRTVTPGAGENFYWDDASFKTVTYSGTQSIANDGDATSAPVLEFTGAASSPVVQNLTRSESLTLGTTIASSAIVTVDSANREIYSGLALTPATNLYSIKSSTDPFPVLGPGANSVAWQSGGTDANTSLEVRWRDAWMP